MAPDCKVRWVELLARLAAPRNFFVVFLIQGEEGKGKGGGGGGGVVFFFVFFFFYFFFFLIFFFFFFFYFNFKAR